MKTLIIGGVAGGATAAARLRRLNEHMEIVILERGGYISFANCGLPYHVGGEIGDEAELVLQTPESFKAQFDVDVRVFNEAVAIERERKAVTVKNLQSGEIYEEGYDKLILSPGAAPLRLPIPGADNERVFTLRSIPDTHAIKRFMEQRQARSAAILGGGAIGVEMAENFKRAGLEVTIIELTDQLIAPIDFDMACEVHEHIRGKGVKLILGNGVKSVEELGDALRIVLEEGEIIADMLLLSAGVRPESQLAKDSGLEVNQRGFILADEHMRTKDPDIYAVGDAIEVMDFMTRGRGAVALAGPANKQGRIAADNICGGDSVYTGTQGSAILKAFDMTVASTGLNEKTATKLGVKYEKIFTVAASHASYYPGASNLTIKTLFDPDTGRILGAQVTGIEGVDKRCDVIATAIRFGATARDLTRLELCYAPPYSSAKDPVNIAGFMMENILTGKVKIFHWHDIAALDPENVTLIDVRAAPAFRMGAVPDFVNIPLEALRGRLREIDKSKPVYVMCQIGLRAYIACRILTQNGYDAHSLSGGYTLWRAIEGSRAKTGVEAMAPAGKANPPKTGLILEPSSQSARKTITINACGLQCPGPIMKLSEALDSASDGDMIEILTTDAAFASDVEAYCKRTGNTFLGTTEGERKGHSTSRVRKGSAAPETDHRARGDGKNFIVFSGDLDKAIAAFIMANAAAAMGRKTRMFFTFWGLNILRKSEKASVGKDFMSSLLAKMMPRGSGRLGLSRMNFAGLGARMIRFVMKSKNVDSLETLMKQAVDNGVEIVACAMSMDIMGIAKEELIDGVKMSGAAYMLAHAEESDMSLFI
ncbi:MAG: FAD-dependent oxidoreductase [Candidatus Accumulibacter sp.]|jgi:NADPH-dependent 2,4-dienoyl-CoA reductase/sulfur reductase-like enzyme/peroxiredoxin family protein/rhodanese-related sulfurtransferase/TusA-related sulfurtransferase|nr:FAD-dependent oxidoreductase [Accumulibacter sp.]